MSKSSILSLILCGSGFLATASLIVIGRTQQRNQVVLAMRGFQFIMAPDGSATKVAFCSHGYPSRLLDMTDIVSRNRIELPGFRAWSYIWPYQVVWQIQLSLLYPLIVFSTATMWIMFKKQSKRESQVGQEALVAIHCHPETY